MTVLDARTQRLSNSRMKLPARPVTALAIPLTGLTMVLAKARAAPVLAAAYPERYTAILWWKIWA
jgi:hypothetical protein